MKKTIWFWLTGIIILLSFVVFMQSEHTWRGFFFPDGCEANTPQCISVRIASQNYGTQKRCIAWGVEQMKVHNSPNDSFNCEEDCMQVVGEMKCREIVHTTRGVHIPTGAKEEI